MFEMGLAGHYNLVLLKIIISALYLKRTNGGMCPSWMPSDVLSGQHWTAGTQCQLCGLLGIPSPEMKQECKHSVEVDS